MNDSILKFIDILSFDSKKLEFFCSLKDIEEMYNFAKVLVKNITQKEFFNFILELARIKLESNEIEKLSDNELNNIASGRKLSNSLAVSFLSLLMLNGTSSYAKSSENKILNNVKYVTSNTITNFKNSKSLQATVGVLGGVALASTVVVGSGIAYKHSDNFFQRHVIGDNLRNNINIPNKKNSKPLTIGENLKGNIYKCENQSGDLAGKCVIFYSGSGIPNENQIGNIVDYYLKKGAIVIGVNYNGFGESGEAVSSGKIREKGIYDDAQKIYDYVKSNFAKNSDKNIIIHGFSLGGPVATYVATNATNDLCGLILQSSVKNTTNAAYNYLKDENFAVRIIGTIGGYLFADQFDCEKQLKILFKKNPNIPIAICGGDNLKDGLNLQSTRLDDFVKKIGFKNIKVYIGNEGHLNSNGAPIENFDIPNF